MRLLAARGIHPPPAGVREKVAAQIAVPEFGAIVINKLAWPALKRKLDRLDSTYKD